MTTPTDPSQDPAPDGAEAPSDRRMPPAAWFAIGLVVVLLGVGVPLLLLGGGDDTDATTTTAGDGVTTTTTVGDVTTTTTGDVTTTTTGETTTTVADTTTTVAETTTTTTPPAAADAVSPRVYFLAETESSNVAGPHLAAVARPLFEPGNSSDLLGSLVQSLLEGPQPDDPELDGLSSSVPEGVTLLGASVSGGVAEIDLSAEFEEGGGSFAMTSRLAQLVFTATQFPDVDAVRLLIDGQEVEVFSSEGIVLDGPQEREDYYDSSLPLVFLDDPAAGDTIGTPYEIAGIANAFEANVLYEVALDGEILTEGFTTATCGTGCWGDFAVEAEFPIDAEGQGTVTVFEISAEDGSRINVQSYPVTILPTS